MNLIDAIPGDVSKLHVCGRSQVAQSLCKAIGQRGQAAELVASLDDLVAAEQPPECIVLPLEARLVPPRSCIHGLGALLTEGGMAVMEIASARNWRRVSALVEGNSLPDMWAASRWELQVWADEAGLQLEREIAIQDASMAEWETNGRPGLVKVGRFEVHDLAEAEAIEYHTESWIVVARKQQAPRGLSASIVIPTRNNIMLTRACLESIRRWTIEDYEVIIVDNGSNDGTADWAEANGCRVIRYSDNKGFPTACNAGLNVASKDYVVFLNNDTLVTPRWLDRLLAPLADDQAVGLVGPRSNNVSGLQQVQFARYNLHQLPSWAWRWSQLRRGERFETDRLVGFCLAGRRHELLALGGFDTRFGIGLFDDDDLGRRYRNEGYQLVVANDCFIHHYGGRTFASEGIDFNALMAENRKRFLEKWREANGSG